MATNGTPILSYVMEWSCKSPPRGGPCLPEPGNYLQISWQQLRQNLPKWGESGIVQRLMSAWSSPLHLVLKPDGSRWPCGDFRLLIDITEADQYPVPHIQDFSGQLQGTGVFSKIDLVRGYHQILVARSDVHKTAVITPFSLYKFLRFGLKNAAQAFLCLMDSVYQGLNYVFVYLYDILVASRTDEKHWSHLAALFDRIKTHGLVLNLAKCVFAQPRSKI